VNDDRKVSMLLDIDNFYGEHEGRLGPTLKFLLIGGAPLLLWVYTGFLILPPVGSVAGESRPHYPGAGEGSPGAVPQAN